MKERTALIVVLILSVAGTLFAGSLSYQELFNSAVSCPAVGAPGTIFGYPACVYGAGMFFILSIVATLGLLGRKV